MTYCRILLGLPALIMLSMLSLLWGCDEGRNGGKTLPNASGREYELVVVTDSALLQNDTLKPSLRGVFGRPFPGIPQMESWFRLNFLQADNLNSYLKRHRNILLVDTGGVPGEIAGLMEQVFGKEKMQAARADTNLFFKTVQDVWARPQQVAFLFAPNKQTLIRKLRESDSTIIHNFHHNELEYLQRVIYKTKEQKGIQRQVQDVLGYSIRVPINYKMAKSLRPETAKGKEADKLRALGLDGFVWLRSETKETSNHILMYSQPYQSRAQLEEDSVIGLRSSVGKAFIPGPAEGSYMWTETEDYAPSSRAINFRERYALQTRGLWEVENDFMGGPFLHYTILDKAQDRVIHLDGFVFAAGTNKKPFMVRMEAILNTLRMASPSTAGIP